MNIQTFDLNLLKVLDALLQEGSTVRAGQRVGLSQPAVSAALGRLRAVFGDPLLVRDGQSLRPTDYALSLVAPVRRLLEDTGHLLARPVFDPATSTDTFRLAASDFFTGILLPDLMARLQRIAPKVVLRYSDAVGPAALDDLREGRLDLAILPVQMLPKWLESEPLFQADYCIIARRNHPVLRRHGFVPGDALTTEVLATLRHAAFRIVDQRPEIQDQQLAALGMTRDIALRASSFTAVWQAVAATDLVGMIPRRLAERIADLAGVDHYPLPFRLPRAKLSQAWHSRNASSRGLIWLRQQVAGILAEVDDGPETP
ncbi:MAG TPA: LysR family transcriptional regulator [Paracoccaceae bacterium]|nr:LysR family transcriptional regulator [Paracoccaceae bacterium]